MKYNLRQIHHLQNNQEHDSLLNICLTKKHIRFIRNKHPSISPSANQNAPFITEKIKLFLNFHKIRQFRHIGLENIPLG
jgi:hypothetical protein